MSRNAIKMICLEQKNLPLQIRLNMIVKKNKFPSIAAIVII